MVWTFLPYRMSLLPIWLSDVLDEEHGRVYKVSSIGLLQYL